MATLKKKPQKNPRLNQDAPELGDFENYALKVPLQPLPIPNVDESKVVLTYDRSIATRVSSCYSDVLLLLSPVIQADQFIVIQVLDTDPSLVGGLRLFIRYLDDLPDVEKRLAYSDSKCRSDDYLIFWLSECGLINIMKNNEKEPKRWKSRSQFQLLCDMYGSVIQLRVYVGDRKKAEPFSKFTQFIIIDEPSNSLLCDINPSISDNSEAFLVCEHRGNEMIPTEVEFPQNVLTDILSCELAPQNDNLEMTTSDGISSPPVIKKSTGHEWAETTESKLCKICVETEVDTVLIPCGHMCLCHKCAAKVRSQCSGTCPICRSTIKQTQKVYLS